MSIINSSDVWRVCTKLGWKYPLQVKKTQAGLVCKWDLTKNFVEMFLPSTYDATATPLEAEQAYIKARNKAIEMMDAVQTGEGFRLALTASCDLVISDV